MQKVELNHPELPTGTVYVPVSEVNRRQNNIGQIDPDNLLLPVILDCLKDKDSKRPSAHQLCERVTDLKKMDKYIDSARTIHERDQASRQLEERERQLGRVHQQLQEAEHVVVQFEGRVAELEQLYLDRKTSEIQKSVAEGKSKPASN